MIATRFRAYIYWLREKVFAISLETIIHMTCVTRYVDLMIVQKDLPDWDTSFSYTIYSDVRNRYPYIGSATYRFDTLSLMESRVLMWAIRVILRIKKKIRSLHATTTLYIYENNPNLFASPTYKSQNIRGSMNDWLPITFEKDLSLTKHYRARIL